MMFRNGCGKTLGDYNNRAVIHVHKSQQGNLLVDDDYSRTLHDDEAYCSVSSHKAGVHRGIPT